MLKELKIYNFALIDALEVHFSSGMTCITGETGAGKSILLGGLSLVLGKRADLSALFQPDKKCVVEAVFDLTDYTLKEVFDELDLDYQSETIIRRELLPQGKSRAFVNDTPVLLQSLEQLSAHLVDIHSQNDTQILLQDSYPIMLLDALAKNENDLVSYQTQLKEYLKLDRHLQQLSDEQSKADQNFELNEFLWQELEAAQLKEGMEKPLEERLEALANVDFLQSQFGAVVQLMDNESLGLREQLIQLRGLLQSIAQKASTYDGLADRSKSVLIEVEDLLEDCMRALEGLEAHPEELQELETQWDQLHRLQQKHKVQSVAALIEIRERLNTTIQSRLDMAEKMAAIDKEKQAVYKSLKQLGGQLSEKRSSSTAVLESELQRLIQKMGMGDAAFKIEITPGENFLSNGMDQVAFLFKANKGGTFKPLKKIASGGEMSRIMLAFKTILCQYKKLPTIIFDEIDTGVSGKVSDQIAQIMVGISKQMQVLTITHLPQVAARGNHHYKVFKKEELGIVQSDLKILEGTDRVEEIAAMLSGNQLTDTAIAHAKQLLN